MPIKSKTFSGLVNGNTYFGKVFTANPKGRVNNRADLLTAFATASATPPRPVEWEFLEAIASDTTWTPPVANAWYRIWVFGKCGDGGARQGSGVTNNIGGSGGNSGGLACSVLLGSDIIDTQCTVNASITSFGNHLSATSGADGDGRYGTVSNVVGVGTGGTEYNLSGFKGGAGVRENVKDAPRGGQGENGGMLGGWQGDSGYYDEEDSWHWQSNFGGGGGGGARLPSPYNGFPYIPDTISNYTAGGGAYMYESRGDLMPSSGIDSKSFPSLDLKNPILYGGGGGAGGNISYNGTYFGGNASAGSPGLIIIERGKAS